MTFPKLTDDGDIVKPGCMPVPAIEIERDELEASLTIVSVPVIFPSDDGANRTWTMLLWPAGIEDDGFPPTTVKPVPEMVAWEMLTDAVPVFVTERFCVALLPTETLPKVRLEGLAERTPGPLGCCGFALVTPAQPERTAAARTTAKTTRETTGPR